MEQGVTAGHAMTIVDLLLIDCHVFQTLWTWIVVIDSFIGCRNVSWSGCIYLMPIGITLRGGSATLPN